MRKSKSIGLQIVWLSVVMAFLAPVFPVPVTTALRAQPVLRLAEQFPQLPPPAKPAPEIPAPELRAVDPIAKGYLDLSKKLFYERQFDEAIPLLKRALERQPELGEAHLFLGRALVLKESYGDAEQNLRKAINDPSIPTKAEAYRMLGIVYGYQGRYEEAASNFERALELAPTNSDMYNSLAYVYALLGENLDRALELVNTAIEKLGPEDTVLFYYLETRAWVYYKMGRYRDAEGDAVKAKRMLESELSAYAIDKVPLKHFYYHLGEIYRVQNKTELARQAFKKALEVDSNYKEALEGLSALPKKPR